jgi:hypothetical protein
MLRHVIALALVVMLFGCLSQPYSTGQQGTGQAVQNQSPPQGGGAQQNATQPVPANASPGFPPPAGQVAQNNTANVTVSPPPAPAQTGPKSTNLTALGLLDAELDALPSKSGGPWFETKYTWVSLEFVNDPKDVTLANPTDQVLFDDSTEKEMVAFGFKTYKPSSGYTVASGYILVYNGSTTLDSRAASGRAVDITYNTQSNYFTFGDATIVSKDVVLDRDNRTLAVYGFVADKVG